MHIAPPLRGNYSEALPVPAWAKASVPNGHKRYPGHDLVLGIDGIPNPKAYHRELLVLRGCCTGKRDYRNLL